MENFNSLGLNKDIIRNLTNLKLIKPTPIQSKAIEPALKGRDILGSAHTGTGKTAAFGIPLIQKLIENRKLSALILTPTRELANQVHLSILDILGKKINIKSTLIIGGESMNKQVNQLKIFPRIIIGTPGRIHDHLVRGNLRLDRTRFLVFDEMDRMLDMGFRIQIEKILKFLPKIKQTLLFSATFPKNIKKITEKYLHNPISISVDEQSTILKKINHEIIQLNQNEKYEKLISIIKERQGSILIFMKTKYSSKKMSSKLKNEGFSVNAIHGDLKQSQRDIVLKKYRDKKYKILVATDIAARGLDIAHIEHVVNYDLPQKSEDYIHRIGRTARAGARGEAICFITPNDKKNWNSIDKLINPSHQNRNRSDDIFKNKKTKNRNLSKKRFLKFKKKINR